MRWTRRSPGSRSFEASAGDDRWLLVEVDAPGRRSRSWELTRLRHGPEDLEGRRPVTETRWIHPRSRRVSERSAKGWASALIRLEGESEESGCTR